MSSFSDVIAMSPYNNNSTMLELKIDNDGDGYVLSDVVKMDGTYTLSIWIKSNKNSVVIFDVLGTAKVVDVSTNWQKVVCTVKANNTDVNNDIVITPEVNTTTYLYEAFLCEGTIDNSWLPAPEDGEEQVASVKSELIQTAKEITAKIESTDGRVTQLTTDLNGITGRVSTAEGDISQIRQEASKIQSDVKNNKGEISQIKQDATQLTSRVVGAEGDISTLKQQAGTLTTEISNAKNEISTIKQQANRVEISVGSSMKKTVDEFYQSNSPTSLVGGSWKKERPVWVEGKYLWRRTLVTYGNDKQEYIPSEDGVCISGNTGAAGQSGIGIEGSEDFYLAYNSDTGVTTKTPGWTPTPQQMSEDKKYLWHYETITYTNKKTESTDPHVIGVYGTMGKDGNGIKDTVDYYQVSQSNTVEPSSWSTTPPLLTSENKYLWNYEVITYTNGQTHETAKRVIGVYGDKGANGANGVGIESVVNYYLAINQNTGVTNKTSGWTTTVQTVSSAKKYLWNYEKITYTNKQIKETDPCIIGMFSKDGVNGQNGTNGTNGKDGVGIKTIEEFYKASNSNKNPPTSWEKTVPTLTPTDRYLWNYELITYTNNQTKETQKRVIGVYGDKGQTGANGKDGKGISSTKIEYQAGTSGTAAPTGAWSTTIPSVAQGKYLWSKTTITYTDKSTSVSYSVAYIPTNGSNGQAGATGTGVGSIVQEYYMSDSKTSQVGSNWQTSMPTWSAGKYLWTRYKITYTNPTKIEYTSPVCDSSWEAVNDIQVGGRNLALKSDQIVKTTEHLISGYNISPSEGKKLSEATAAEQQPIVYGHLVEGDTYTISVCVKPGNNTKSIEARVSQGKSVLCSFAISGTERQILSKTITCKYAIGSTPTQSVDNATVGFYRMPNETNISYGENTIYWVKIERGNKSTDWSPAPEDVQSGIDDLTEQVNANRKHLSSLEVGNQEILMSVQTIEKNTSDAINGINNELSELHKDVGMAITEDELKIHVSQEIKKGVNNVTTSTGFTFNDEGLMVSKTNSELSTKITEDGMKVLKNKEVVLEANSVGVNAKNLHATTYLIIGKNSRFEDFGNRTGCFWIGGV